MTEESRRSFLGVGSAALVGAAIRWGRSPLLANGRPPRVGIVGGGMAGLSCAWLLDGVADASIFESRSEPGGHAHTISVEVDGERIQADVGAQFFARGPQPTYLKLLEVLGLTGSTVESEMTITASEVGRETPRFVSPSRRRLWAFVSPWNRPALRAFLVLALAARRLTRSGDWKVTVDEWLGRLPVPREERERLLLPLLSAMVGCRLSEARGLSARGALVFIGKALPENLLQPFRYRTSLLGLGGIARHLALASGNLTFHPSTPVTALTRGRSGGFVLRTASGLAAEVDLVVLATPPVVSRQLLSHLPGFAGARAALAEFDSFDASVSIHRDPIYMPANPRYWSAYNTSLRDDRAEASVWYGALRSTRVSLFKSWTTDRPAAPGDEVFRRAFRHPLVTPSFLRAQRRLEKRQGRGGVWFAGSYTTEVDSQETALVSAIRVVEHIAPQAPNLKALTSAAVGASTG